MILVADDDKGVLDLYKAFLTEEGYDVLAAEDGEAALNLFNENAGSVELVITDMEMPKMTGPELIDELKSSLFNIELPIIIVSGEEPHWHGVDDTEFLYYLRKPFRVADLKKLLTSVLKE